MSKQLRFCVLALLFLVVVNLAGFHQVGAASSAPAWMKDGAYMKYTIAYPTVNRTTDVRFDFVAVHEHTADMVVSAPSISNSSAIYGHLDLQTRIFQFEGQTEGERFSFWLDARSLQVGTTVNIGWLWPGNATVAGSGFPPDNIDYPVECWVLDGTEYVHGIIRLWYDKHTGLLMELESVDRTSVLHVLLSETNIPVGRLGVGPTIVETLTGNSMTYATVLIAAVSVVAVAVIALVMFRKRTPVVCEKCGRKMGRESTFCDKCGTALASTERS